MTPPDDAAADEQEFRAATRATAWLAVGLVVAPFAQTLEWDFDRAAPLALLALPLWSGRRALDRAMGRVWAGPRAARGLLAMAAASAALATLFSPQPAAALVALASWTLLGLGALLAGQLVRENPPHGRTLLGALALSAALGTACHWLRWKMGAAPEGAFYPHHRLMGLHLLSGAVAATMLLARSAGRARAAWLAAGALAWGGLLWTGGRAPLLGALAGLALAAVLAREARRTLLPAAALHLALGLALAAALDAHKPHLGWRRLWQQTAAASTPQELTSNRSDFWRAAWERAAETPLLGRGPDAYRFLEPKLEGAQPHNALLQWLLDLGAAGAVAVAALAAWSLARAAGSARRRQTAEPAPHDAAAWLALAGGTLLAGQLDGFFYHQIALLPAAIAFGICALDDGPALEHAPTVAPGRAAWRGLAVAVAGVLALHGWLFHHVAVAPPPAPTDRVVRVWRAFPSCTLGLERWLEAWRERDPAAALALSRFAQAHSAQGDFFHVQTAGLLWRQGDRAGARRELEAALAIAPWQMRPVIEGLRAQLAAGDAARHD